MKRDGWSTLLIKKMELKEFLKNSNFGESTLSNLQAIGLLRLWHIFFFLIQIKSSNCCPFYWGNPITAISGRSLDDNFVSRHERFIAKMI